MRPFLGEAQKNKTVLALVQSEQYRCERDLGVTLWYQSQAQLEVCGSGTNQAKAGGSVTTRFNEGVGFDGEM